MSTDTLLEAPAVSEPQPEEIKDGFASPPADTQPEAITPDEPKRIAPGQWYFQRYIENLPTKGELVFSSTAPGTTAAGSSTSWASARPTSISSSCARLLSSSA